MASLLTAKCHAAHFNDVLPRPDRPLFLQLKEPLSASGASFNRNSTLRTLKNQLESIRPFCVRHDLGDCKRSFVRGVCSLEDGTLAINAKQFGSLIGKSQNLH
jgi:hypothetical protein